MHSFSKALLTDLYQLTMAYGYWKSGQHNRESVFQLFFRRPPFQGGFTLIAGLQHVVDYLENFRFEEEDIAYLANIKNKNNKALFSKEFLDYLSTLKFSCHLDAVPEGTILFPEEPILRIQGPIIQCQIFESCLLNLINFSSLIATKAARICLAAEGDMVLEFGLRRAQGIDGALTASRSAYIGGCEATSNVLAGKLYDIPVKGTHSHSWVMAFEDELDSFQTFAECHPDNCVLLVDTYDSLEGIKKSIKVAEWLKQNGSSLLGIRLDSGDLAKLSKEARILLDEAGLKDTVIIASNELDEYVIRDLKLQGAQINVWGVGTNLVTAKEQAALDGVYKLGAIKNSQDEWVYKVKLSEDMSKVSHPGIQQVRRFYNESGYVSDLVYDVQIGCEDKNQYKDLLIPIFRNGKKVYNSPSIHEIREKANKELSLFPQEYKSLEKPAKFPVDVEKNLENLRNSLIGDLCDLKRIKIKNESLDYC